MADKRLLILDSDKAAGHGLANACRNFNFKVAHLESGDDLFEALEDSRPECLILAVELAGTSGFVLYKKVRAEAKFRDLPVILIGTKAQDEAFAKHKKLKDKAEAYLIKPIASEDMIDTLEHLIGLPPPPSTDDPRYDELETAYRKLTVEAAEWEKAVEKKDREIKLLKESYENVSNKLEKTKADLSALKDGATGVVNKIQNVEKKHADEVSRLEARLEEAELKKDRDSRKLIEEMEQFQQIAADSQAQAVELRKQQEALQRRSDLADAENMKREAALKERIKDLLSQVDDERRKQEEDHAKIESVLVEYQEKIDGIEEQRVLLEQEKIKMEQRVVKAYKKIKMDQVRDEKLQKALEIAMTLLESSRLPASVPESSSDKDQE